MSPHTLPCIEINPSTPATQTVIWLHGLGADGNDFVPIVPQLHLPPTSGIRFVFPHAPVMPITLNQGYKMRAWFDIEALSRDAKIDAVGIANAVRQIGALIEQEEANGIASDRIILAGFSQGAVIALTAGLCHPKPLAGIMALSGYLPLADDVLKRASDANRQIPLFIAHGTEDSIIPIALGNATYATLKQAGYPASWHAYPMPHAVCEEEIRDISAWLQSTLEG